LLNQRTIIISLSSSHINIKQKTLSIITWTWNFGTRASVVFWIGQNYMKVSVLLSDLLALSVLLWEVNQTYILFFYLRLDHMLLHICQSFYFMFFDYFDFLNTRVHFIYAAMIDPFKSLFSFHVLNERLILVIFLFSEDLYMSFKTFLFCEGILVRWIVDIV